jgi:dihydrofolate reductase
MKTVFTNSTVVTHLFAQQTQSEGRSSNIFFNRNKIYSYGYHYLLGEFIENNKGQKAILINDKGYSSTTSGHISDLRQATRQYKQFFVTETNVDFVLQSIESNVNKLITARKKELYIIPSQKLFESLNEFIKWQENKITPKTEQYKKIVRLMKVINGDNLTEYLENESKRIKSEAKKEAKKQLQKLTENIEKFYNYDTDRVYNSNQDYVRLSQDNENVETSQNVKVSRKEAKVLYNLIENKKDIKGFVIGGYTVISINGTLTIGCHHINIESINRIGNQL